MTPHFAFAADLNRGTSFYKSKDYSSALAELAPLAEKGVAVAQFYIGNMYRDGNGVSQNFAEAVRYYRMAAAQGHPTAQNNLGARYRRGEGVEKNNGLALMWYMLASEQGHKRAAQNASRLKSSMPISEIERSANSATICKAQGYKNCAGNFNDLAFEKRTVLDPNKGLQRIPGQTHKSVFWTNTAVGRTGIPLPQGDWKILLEDTRAYNDNITVSRRRETVLIKASGNSPSAIIVVNQNIEFSGGKGWNPPALCYYKNWAFLKQESILPHNNFCWGLRKSRFPEYPKEGTGFARLNKKLQEFKFFTLNGRRTMLVQYARNNKSKWLRVTYYFFESPFSSDVQLAKKWAESNREQIVKFFGD